MIKYLRRDNLSSKNNDVKVDAHPGWTTLDMLDYIKPIVRRKPDVLVIHTGTNDLTNGVNTMNEVRQLVKCVKELDKEEEVKIGFSSVINRSDRNLEKEIVDLNLKRVFGLSGSRIPALISGPRPHKSFNLLNLLLGKVQSL